MACTVLIDESGDTGISTIRSAGKGGSSDYFTMGAVVLQEATAVKAVGVLGQLEHRFRKKKPWKHATELNHSQKLLLCKEMSKMHARFFGVISYKPTLGEYANEIGWEPDKFYNKCAKYLLEIVGSYLASVDANLLEPQIIFEQRNHNYDAMIRYLSKVKETPLYAQSSSLEAINPFAITNKKKSEEPLLRLADMVSHALYCCVNKTPDNFQITESRYLRELSARFAADQRGRVVGAGIKPIHSLNELALDEEVEKELVGLRAMPRP